jgi:Ca2+-binding RTX toxin-like protein
MTIRTTSDPTGTYGPPSDITYIVAPDVTIGALHTSGQNVHLVNYGSIGPDASLVSNSSVSLDTGADATFVNKADGFVVRTRAGGAAIEVQGTGSVVNEGTVLCDAGHGIGVTGATANNVSISNSGDLYGRLNGIWVAATSAQNVTISNSGEIIGDANGVHMQFGVGAAPTIFNTGVITGRGGNSIIATDGDRLNLTNYGTLNGHVTALSAGLADSVFNNGRIVGNVNLGSGNDVYRGVGSVSGTVSGEAGNDALSGGNGADKLDGATENDTLIGNGGGDTLIGGAGIDTLFGGLGVDSLNGGANADFFVFNTALNAVTNRDIITGFSHVDDTIRLENAIFSKLAAVGSLNPAFFRVGAAALDANDYIVYNPTNGVLSYDNNGNAAGGSTAFAVLALHPAVAGNDFQVI